MASLGISKRVASHGGASHPGNLRGFMEECIVIQEENEDIPIPSNGSLGKCAGAKPQMDVDDPSSTLCWSYLFGLHVLQAISVSLSKTCHFLTIFTWCLDFLSKNLEPWCLYAK